MLFRCLAVLALWGRAASLNVNDQDVLFRDSKAQAMTQRDVVVRDQKLQPKRSSPCDCMSWADAYRSNGVRCGAVHEGFGTEMCTTFFERIEDTVCLNIKQGRDEGQWCYVSSECQDLNGGAVLHPIQSLIGLLGTNTGKMDALKGAFAHQKVSWKKCKAGEDKLSREKTVEQTLTWAHKNDLMPALVLKMAYPVWQRHMWHEVKPFFDKSGNAISSKIFPKELRDELQKHMASERPIIFDSRDHHPPFGVLEGNKLFISANNGEYLKGRPAWNLWESPYLMNTVTLAKGK